MKFLAISLGLISLAQLVAADFQPIGVPFKSPVTVAGGFIARVAFSNLTAPRGIAFDSENNLLVVERGLGVTVFTRVTTPTPGFERTVIIKNLDLTHGIAIEGQLLYVSTATRVLAYRYDPLTKSVDTAPSYPYVAVEGLPGDGEIITHTILLEKNATNDAVSAFLVGAGPFANIDPTARDPASGRSQIRRMAVPRVSIPIFPPRALQWADGQILAYGLRNPGGFAYDVGPSIDPVGTKSLYVVDNGATLSNVSGLTPKFANDNPSDEMNLVKYPTLSVDAKPKFYGFPDCASLWNPNADPVGVPQYTGLPRGTQFSLNLDTTRTDAWCRNTVNNVHPSLDFQASSVPLDIKFYTPQISTTPVSFPATFSGDAFVSFHGSFSRVPPTGYGVVHVPFPLGISSSAQPYSFLVQATNINTCPGNCIRPVGLAFGKDGRLYVSSDSSGELFVIERSLATTD